MDLNPVEKESTKTDKAQQKGLLLLVLRLVSVLLALVGLVRKGGTDG